MSSDLAPQKYDRPRRLWLTQKAHWPRHLFSRAFDASLPRRQKPQSLFFAEPGVAKQRLFEAREAFFSFRPDLFFFPPESFLAQLGA